jgi:NAD-dependent deacetylase sirtuin 4
MHELAPADSEIEALVRLFDRGPVAVLTGAGISTESGIPDYRGPETRRRARNPMQYRDFLRSAAARQRYWARSMLGWPRFARARPNAGHAAITKLARAGLIPGLITQNVDGLHNDAGTSSVELHGALREAICLQCQQVTSRARLQAELEAKNPAFVAHSAELAPDGDSDFEDDGLEHFQVVDCTCGGALKPHVVFFGENVPPPRVAQAMEHVQAGSALLVIGSSLAVYSGLRFVHAAQKRAVPIAIVSYGETRGDPAATLRIDAGAGLTLTRLTDRLGL